MRGILVGVLAGWSGILQKGFHRLGLDSKFEQATNRNNKIYYKKHEYLSKRARRGCPLQWLSLKLRSAPWQAISLNREKVTIYR